MELLMYVIIAIGILIIFMSVIYNQDNINYQINNVCIDYNYVSGINYNLSYYCVDSNNNLIKIIPYFSWFGKLNKIYFVK
jgi:hypothetical protein